MSEKIVLIDGHSILNRAFYGVPDLTNSEGLHTNAVYGFLNIMFKILEEEKPEYLTVAFDVHAPTFRHEMFAEYKGTRKPMADELRQQVPVIKEVLQAMGVKTIEKAGLEADDLLGTLAKRCEEMGMEVSVISGDRDLLQLATEHVKIRIPKTKQGKTEIEDYYAADVKARYQVTPEEFIDLKALMGDTSDNIPGVPSIGEKTATKIITEYGSIENAYAHVTELKPPRASKALSEHYDLAQMSKVLATIHVNADFEYEIADAKLGDLYTEEAYVYFQRLQFKNLLSRFEVTAPANRIEDAFRVVTDQNEAKKIFEKAKKQTCVGVSFYKDTKNVLPLFVNEAGLTGVGLAFGKEDIYVFTTEQGMEISELLEQVEALSKEVDVLAIADVKNAMQYIPNVNQSVCFDTIVAAYLLNPLKNDYESADIAREYLDILIDDNQIDEAQKSCYEAYTAYESSGILRDRLKETEMEQLFDEIEMPLVFTLYDMEQNGVKVAAEALHIYGEQLGQKIVDLEKDIYELTGETFNINSPKQLGVILFEKLGLPHVKKTKTGYSTSADILDKLAPEYPVVSKILEYRQLTKLKSTYADGLAGYIKDDGRIHGKFNQTITATGRISSTEPNLQNIPVRMELGRLIRKVFIPEDGYVFVDADYSQIELRIMAHLSRDKGLLTAFAEGKDIHRATAAEVFGLPLETVTSEQRRSAKAINFGLIYGMSAFGLARQLNIPRKEAQKYMDLYFERYPGVLEYMERTRAQAKEQGYVETLDGRRLYLPDIKSSNGARRAAAERAAINAPMQGTAADIIKRAMIAVDAWLQAEQPRVRMIMQVHDELVFEVHKDDVDAVAKQIHQLMENCTRLDVPLLVEVGRGENWDQAH